MTPAKKPKNSAVIEKAIEEAVNAAADKLSSKHIESCSFVGVQWDAKAVDAVSKIADGLAENARSQRATAEGLKTLAEVLKASNVSIETMMKITN